MTGGIVSSLDWVLCVSLLCRYISGGRATPDTLWLSRFAFQINSDSITQFVDISFPRAALMQWTQVWILRI